MTDFEKALEERAYDVALISNGITHPIDYDSFVDGARWAREFTIVEVIKFVRHYGYFNVADAIAVNFKDRGGE